MARRDIVVIGASAGGVEALQKLVSGLPADLPASVFVVLHIPPFPPSKLADILERYSALPVEKPQDGAPILPGRIYTGVADRHLLFKEQRIRLTRGPKENRVRPAIDVLFRSAAVNFGSRVVGVILTGNLDDGTAGLWAIKDRGGLALVQAPDDALYPSMPQNALEHVQIDGVLPASELARQIVALCQQRLSSVDSLPGKKSDTENRVAMGNEDQLTNIMQLGSIAANTCPTCHGVLVQIREGSILRYRCHTGHAFSMQSLLAELDEELDTTLGNIQRILEERLFLLRDLRQEPSVERNATRAAYYERQIERCSNWSKRVHDLSDDLELADPDL